MTNCHHMKWTILVGVLLASSTASAFLVTIDNNNYHKALSSPSLSLHPPSYFCCFPRHPFSITNHHLAAAASSSSGVVGGDDEQTGVEEQKIEEANAVAGTTTITTPVFDFTGGETSSEDEKAKSLSSFDRIDDAIMGGISLSSLKGAGVGVPYASWSGKCRIEGGGFCGFRTLPFKVALDTTNQDGIYIDCRLASDDEPQRRVWKMTMRTESKRTTEIVYQAEFNLGSEETCNQLGGGGLDDDNWSRVKVPFDSFQLVRGPRLVPNMPPPDVSDGIFQIGISLSKFVMGVNMTELPDFRPGYFDLQIQSIGFFKGGEVRPTGGSSAITTSAAIQGATTGKDGKELGEKTIVPETLSKAEVDKNRPVLFKILSPLLKFFFSENSRRRKTAMKILTETRGMSRRQAILFGIKSRRKGSGLVRSLGKTLRIISVDATRAVFFNVLKVALFYPFKLIFAVIRVFKKALGMEVKTPITG